MWADSNYDIEFCVTFPLADGQDDAAVKAKKPQLIAALSGIARRGSVAVTGFTPEVFNSARVLPLLTDPVQRTRCANGMPVSPAGFFESWRP